MRCSVEFRAIVERHQGDKGVRKLSCWGQFVALFFGQLTGQHSLRDLITTLGWEVVSHYGIRFQLNNGHADLIATYSNAESRTAADPTLSAFHFVPEKVGEI